ncbi:MAG: hypothetical protein IKO41_11420, partial [Lachnospiraceae bacterium]|nr:hypothetical protein [Lachnospiraceae bacterium]
CERQNVCGDIVSENRRRDVVVSSEIDAILPFFWQDFYFLPLGFPHFFWGQPEISPKMAPFCPITPCPTGWPRKKIFGP